MSIIKRVIPSFMRERLACPIKDSHLGFQLPKNCHLHQCNRHHIRNQDSIPLLLQPMLHKQDISYSLLPNVNQNQSKHSNDNSNSPNHGIFILLFRKFYHLHLQGQVICIRFRSVHGQPLRRIFQHQDDLLLYIQYLKETLRYIAI